MTPEGKTFAVSPYAEGTLRDTWEDLIDVRNEVVRATRVLAAREKELNDAKNAFEQAMYEWVDECYQRDRLADALENDQEAMARAGAATPVVCECRRCGSAGQGNPCPPCKDDLAARAIRYVCSHTTSDGGPGQVCAAVDDMPF